MLNKSWSNVKIALIKNPKTPYQKVCTLLERLDLPSLQITLFTPEQVESIAPRYEETQANRYQGSRSNLLRVIYLPSSSEISSEALSSLSQEEKNYLQKPLNVFADFEIVVELSEGMQFFSHGLNLPVGSELQEVQGFFQKPADFFSREKEEKILIYGAGERTHRYINSLLEKTHHRVFHFFHQKLEDREDLSRFNARALERFSNDLERWRGLPDYEQVKWPKPESPELRYHQFEHTYLHTMTYLSDRQSLYLSYERPKEQTLLQNTEYGTLAVDGALSFYEPDRGPRYLYYNPTLENEEEFLHKFKAAL